MDKDYKYYTKRLEDILNEKPRLYDTQAKKTVRLENMLNNLKIECARNIKESYANKNYSPEEFIEACDSLLMWEDNFKKELVNGDGEYRKCEIEGYDILPYCQNEDSDIFLHAKVPFQVDENTNEDKILNDPIYKLYLYSLKIYSSLQKEEYEELTNSNATVIYNGRINNYKNSTGDKEIKNLVIEDLYTLQDLGDKEKYTNMLTLFKNIDKVPNVPEDVTKLQIEDYKSSLASSIKYIDDKIEKMDEEPLKTVAYGFMSPTIQKSSTR